MKLSPELRARIREARIANAKLLEVIERELAAHDAKAAVTTDDRPWTPEEILRREG